MSGHFGQTPCFVMAELDGSELVSSRLVAAPGHGPGCGVPAFVHGLGVSAVIVGGIGGGAVAGPSAHGIEVVAGAVGNAGDLLSAFAKGELAPGVSACHGHGCHGHGCHHHHD